ncbi:cyclin-dependent kinase F-4 [Ricinus communis]|uniref:cyclin-dependent kinase n=1 Tax=Ricinus communis TaxID=3988 RepID=B9SRW8_RICCO|nr:cyclin-dependent kinase F-4 [Ricinus communis]EEF33649.1 mak, putative [Ricinus communis]|eukprot:XP_002528737.1 cyclin-dependent kinase F-4 [Ricinus communis]
MEKYEFIENLGHGSYGCVCKAINKVSGETVAIKILKKSYSSWDECLNLREVKSLRRMANHPNIVQLKELALENKVVFLVFECMECNLHQVMEARGNRIFSEREVKNWCFQIFQGLADMHRQGYFHRDLKPENLLVRRNTVKIGDLGLAREINSEPYTERVGTRWYRAPEVLLQSRMYSAKVDMWSLGVIMAELFSSTPLFPGTSEADQMFKICKVIGSPTKECWSDGLDLARNIRYQFPEFGAMDLSQLIPTASKDALSLIKSLCSWDPCKRPTAEEALQHPFFHSCYSIPPTIPYEAPGIIGGTPVSSIRQNKELLKALASHYLQGIEIDLNAGPGFMPLGHSIW